MGFFSNAARDEEGNELKRQAHRPDTLLDYRQ